MVYLCTGPSSTFHYHPGIWSILKLMNMSFKFFFNWVLYFGLFKSWILVYWRTGFWSIEVLDFGLLYNLNLVYYRTWLWSTVMTDIFLLWTFYYIYALCDSSYSALELCLHAWYYFTTYEGMIIVKYVKACFWIHHFK